MHPMYHSIMSPFCLFHMCCLYCIPRCSRGSYAATLRPVVAIPVVLAVAAFVVEVIVVADSVVGGGALEVMKTLIIH